MYILVWFLKYNVASVLKSWILYCHTTYLKEIHTCYLCQLHLCLESENVFQVLLSQKEPYKTLNRNEVASINLAFYYYRKINDGVTKNFTLKKAQISNGCIHKK